MMITDPLLIVKDLTVKVVNPNADNVVGVTNDSRQATPSSAFVAITGAEMDGHAFIDSAIVNGATVILHSKPLDHYSQNVMYIQVNDSYYAYALLAEAAAGHPARELSVAGITGTNGKTTTAFILHQILSEQGLKTGLISTVKYLTGGTPAKATRTTPAAGDLQRMFSDMKEHGCTHAVMEASSHALDQHRLGSTKFTTAVFTNLTGDHLDYHGDMDGYFEAKKKLFFEYLPSPEKAIVNNDDPYGRELLSLLPGAISYGMSAASIFRIDSPCHSLNDTTWQLSYKGKSYPVHCGLVGDHNIANATAAIASAVTFGVPIENAIVNVRNVSVPGRLEKYRVPDGPLVFVDYAHTDDALEYVLSTLAPLTEGRLCCVFGCGGDRDRTKRPRMAQVVAKYSDCITVTSDNPRRESPTAIIHDICQGFPQETRFTCIEDRQSAILGSIKNATPDDVVLIAGKGHEDYQEISGEKYPFSDRAVVESLSSSMKS